MKHQMQVPDQIWQWAAARAEMTNPASYLREMLWEAMQQRQHERVETRPIQIEETNGPVRITGDTPTNHGTIWKLSRGPQMCEQEDCGRVIEVGQHAIIFSVAGDSSRKHYIHAFHRRFEEDYT